MLEKIPKLIHQIYWDFSDGGKNPCKEFNFYHEVIKRLHPEFSIKIWDYDSIKILVESCLSASEYTCFLQLPNVIKVDFARLLILREHGGIYLDMDIYLRKSLNSIVHNFSAVLFAVDNDECCNAAMGCSKNHPFFKKLLIKARQKLRDIVEHCNVNTNCTKEEFYWYVMYAFGPKFLTVVVKETYECGNLPILPLHMFDVTGGNIRINVNETIDTNLVIFPPQSLLGFEDNLKGYIYGCHVPQKTWLLKHNST